MHISGMTENLFQLLESTGNKRNSCSFVL